MDVTALIYYAKKIEIIPRERELVILSKGSILVKLTRSCGYSRELQLIHIRVAIHMPDLLLLASFLHYKERFLWEMCRVLDIRPVLVTLSWP